MRSLLFGSLLAVLLVGLSAPELKLALADCTAEGCEGQGPKTVSCPDAPSTIQFCRDQGAAVCDSTTQTIVQNNLWFCGSVQGKCDCRDGGLPEPKCYDQWTCKLDDEEEDCEPDPDTHSVHRKVTKIADTCSG